MPKDESENLLKKINLYTNNESFIYSHYWKPYDLIMWDNRAVLHRATPIQGKIEQRLMVRTTIAGETSTLNY
jgi:alpha-ketoglutarate-dependent taurine dioxygenase